MVVLELALTSAWQQICLFFMRGDPPLAWRLLAVNAVFLAALVIRRMVAGYRLRSPAAEIIQAVVIGSNLLVMSTDGLPPALRQAVNQVF